MDTRTGELMRAEEVRRLQECERKFYKEMNLEPTPDQLKDGKVQRNDPCPCGSGKKFKKCCLNSVK